MSSPSILVLWYQRLVLTTMMSPGLILASMSPWHAHQHSGGGRSSQRLVPDTWACHELRSTLSMCTWAPGPGVPEICHTWGPWGPSNHQPMNIHGFFGVVDSGWRKLGLSINSRSFSAICKDVLLQSQMLEYLIHYLRLTHCPSHIPVTLPGASHSV